MRNKIYHRLQLFTQVTIAAIFLYSCAVSQIELTKSWTNKTTTVKQSPLVMVMVLGKSPENRKSIEKDMIGRLKKKGIKAVGSLDVFQPEVQKYDSAQLVSLLRQNKIDMILINAVLSITEKERYIPGGSQEVQVSQNATPYSSAGYQVGYYGNYYGFCNNYESMTEKRFIPGKTVTDVVVLIESHLYDVAKPELLWVGQSKTYTKEPSVELFKEFSKIIIEDITKNNLLLK
jgi:hypothetical protein